MGSGMPSAAEASFAAHASDEGVVVAVVEAALDFPGLGLQLEYVLA